MTSDSEDMATAERKKIQDTYIRVCRDSGFQLEATRAAVLTSEVMGVHALQVWNAMQSFDNMQRVASGEHPAAQRPSAPAGSM
jgi:hypothetical protein